MGWFQRIWLFFVFFLIIFWLPFEVFCVFGILRISPNKTWKQTQKQTQRNTQAGISQTQDLIIFWLFFDFFFDYFLFLFWLFFDYFLFFFWAFNLILFSFDFLVWFFIDFFWFLIKSLISAFWEEFPIITLENQKPSRKNLKQHLYQRITIPLENAKPDMLSTYVLFCACP